MEAKKDINISISKEDFIGLLISAVEYDDWIDMLDKNGISLNAPALDGVTRKIIDFFERALDDDEGVIKYYLWGIAGGHYKSEKRMITSTGKPILIESAEDVWDYLTNK